jgi:hypothetical protein
MFGSDMIDYLVLGLMVLVGLGGVGTWYMGVQKTKRV